MDVLYRALFSIAGVAIISYLINTIIRLLFDLSAHSQRLKTIIGFCVASAGIFISITFYNELREIPKDPEQISIENLADRMSTKDHLWVSIPDGQWDCQNMAFDGRDTFAALLNKAETVVVVVSFDAEKTCRELRGFQPSGRLAKPVGRQFIYISNYIDFSKYDLATPVLNLCAYCGRLNSQLGIGAGIFFTLFGLFFDIRHRVGMHTTGHRPRPQDLMN